MSEADNSSSSRNHYGGPTPLPNLMEERGERRAFYLFLLFLLALFTTAIWLLFGDHAPAAPRDLESAFDMDEGSDIYEPIQPLPLHVELDPHKVALGQRLFFDPRLSRDNTIACAACHDLSRGGADGKVVATGIGGAQGEINTLSVFNSAYQLAWFWDGRGRSGARCCVGCNWLQKRGGR